VARQHFSAALGLLRSLIIYHSPTGIIRWRRFYRGLLAPRDLVFDVGAHVGTRARAMNSAGASVIAIEPQQPFAGFLRRTLPRDIRVLPVAVGQTPSKATLAVSSRHPTVSTLSADFVTAGKTATGFTQVNWDRTQQVQVVTLDDLIGEYGVPHYIKIDVEGSEGAVLAGLSHPVALISVEYLPALPHLARALVRQLQEMGNDRFNIVQGEGGSFLWPDWRDADAVTAWLASQGSAAQSGDLFARRPGATAAR